MANVRTRSCCLIAGTSAARARARIARICNTRRYERIDTTALETDGKNVFGEIAAHARYKWLLSLEGHSYWSFRLRQLAHLNSAILHQVRMCFRNDELVWL